MARPTKYKDEYPEKLIKYFKEYLDNPNTRECIEEIVKYHKEGGVRETIKKWKIIPKGVPTLFGFSRLIGVEYNTVLRWSKERVKTAENKEEIEKSPFKYPEFCRAYKEVKQFQTEYLIKVGIGGTAPSTFAIFTAKNMVGWRDKNEIGLTDQNGKDVKPGYVLLPTRKTAEDAEKEYSDQQATVTTV